MPGFLLLRGCWPGWPETAPDQMGDAWSGLLSVQDGEKVCVLASVCSQACGRVWGPGHLGEGCKGQLV